MSAVVRIDKELLPYIDGAMEITNESGARRYGSRCEVVSEAVREFVRNHGVKPVKEAGG